MLWNYRPTVDPRPSERVPTAPRQVTRSPAGWLRSAGGLWSRVPVPWRAGAVCLALVAAGAGPWIEVAAAFLGRRTPFWIAEDFTAFYAAAKLIISGSGHRIFDISAIAAAERAAAGHQVGGTGVLAYFNPPFFALAFAPLTVLSLEQAYQVWTILSLGLLALNGWLLWRIAAPLPRPWRTALLVGYLTLYPVTFGLRLGQFSLILQAAWGAGYLLLRQGRERLAGFALAPLLIKPELLLPVAVFLAWKRRFRVFSTLVPLALATAGISIAIVGIPAALAYPGYLMDSTTWNNGGVASNLMFNWMGILAASGGDSLHHRVLAAAVLPLGTLAAAALLWRGELRPGTRRFPVQWLALTLATVLADPHLYLQDTVLLVPAAAAVTAVMRGRQRLAAGVSLLFAWTVLRLALYPNQHLHVDLFALSMAATLGALVLAQMAAGRGSPVITPAHAREPRGSAWARASASPPATRPRTRA